MTQQHFVELITQRFGLPPTRDQLRALQTFAGFLADRQANVAMIMRGSAGTGKTSLAAAMMKTLFSLGQKVVLLAPTGRAAKVFEASCGMAAGTIHRRIYREKAYVGIGGTFNLADNRSRNTLFAVDEASMIGTHGDAGSGTIGGASLLDDLLRYVYSGDNCRLLLIGDTAQLPPVGEDESPALNAGNLRASGMRVYECDLDEVVRQTNKPGILLNATRLRRMAMPAAGADLSAFSLPKITFSGFTDIVNVPGEELAERLQDSYNEVGEDETIVITRSNKRANMQNQGIRRMVLGMEDAICGGDRLMVVKNKYLEKGFIANGDRCVVRRVRNFRELYGFHFADATLLFPDYGNQEMEETVVLDALYSESPALTREQTARLFDKVMEDYADLPTKPDRLRALKQDRFFNALQVKFSYAVTCHKAQGGQWKHVYVDQGYMTEDMLTPDYIHWLYTAFTRATGRLFLVNWPKEQTDNA